VEVRKLSNIRMPELDGIRGFALSMILVWHFIVGTIDPETAPPWLASLAQWLTITWSSIDMFFVLSGYLIGGILIDHRGATNLFRVFYVRRCLRIMPLYTIWVLLYLLLLLTPIAGRFPWLFEDPLPSWGYLIYLQNMTAFWQDRFGPHWMGITWSLAIEEQFYLILPLMVFLSPPRWMPWLAIGAVLSATPLRIMTQQFLPNHEWAGWFPIWCRWDSLFMGVFLAWMRRQPWWESTAHGQPRAIAWMIFLSTLAWLIAMTAGNTVYPGNWHILTYGLTLISLLYGSLLFLTLHDRRLARFFSWPIWVFMGTISYGLYIFHQAVLGLVHGIVYHEEPRLERWDHLVVTLIASAATIVLANISFRYFEKPLVQYGHGWKYKECSAESVRE
jgi:peptidoglycan/LPS O-acetylase OafA/YrhL